MKSSEVTHLYDFPLTFIVATQVFRAALGQMLNPSPTARCCSAYAAPTPALLPLGPAGCRAQTHQLIARWLRGPEYPGKPQQLSTLWGTSTVLVSLQRNTLSALYCWYLEIRALDFAT